MFKSISQFVSFQFNAVRLMSELSSQVMVLSAELDKQRELVNRLTVKADTNESEIERLEAGIDDAVKDALNRCDIGEEIDIESMVTEALKEIDLTGQVDVDDLLDGFTVNEYIDMEDLADELGVDQADLVSAVIAEIRNRLDD